LAILIPEQIGSAQVPPGERKFHAFLGLLFESRPDIIAWHRVRVCGKEIDFILFLPRLGLFVVEVKDWFFDTIQAAGPDTFTILEETGEKTRTSPYVQARECAYRVREALEQEPSLVQPAGKHKGKPVLPVGHLVAFPNISRAEAQACPHGERMDPRMTIFQEDLADGGPYLRRPADGATSFLSFADRALPVRFPASPLSGPQMEALRKKVFTDCVITCSVREPRRPARRVGEVAMDLLQELYARELGGGPRLLKGVAGSGKTLVLVHRAMHLARYQPLARRILFTCYNLSLANHVRDLIVHNLPEDRRARVVARPFYDLCGDVLKEPVEHEGRDTAYYDDLTARAAARVGDVPEGERADAVLVDEGQDFSPEMFGVVLGLLRSKDNDFMVATDAEQDIYGRFTLRDFGIDFRGRVHMLPASYRSTQQIFDFAHRVAGKAPPPPMDPESGQMLVFPQYMGRTGPEPRTLSFEDVDRLVSFLVRDIRELIRVDRIPLAEVAVLYLSRRRPSVPDPAAPPARKDALTSLGDLKALLPGVDNRRLAARIAAALSSEGIPVNWFTENSARKSAFDLHDPTVKIGTIHSAKGMDFEVVYLVDTTGDPLTFPKKGALQDEPERRYRTLLFVGCTRARERLTLLGLTGKMP
jgi:hypothetical protein